MNESAVRSPARALPNEAVGKAVSSAAPLVRLSRVLDRLADELASGRAGPAYSLVPEGTHLVAQGPAPIAVSASGVLAPALWATKKAAERWTAKNTPEAIRDIIRVWGVLN